MPDKSVGLISVEKLGFGAWCRKYERVDEYNSLGTITVRDIRTDKVLGWKFCFALRGLDPNVNLGTGEWQPSR